MELIGRINRRKVFYIQVRNNADWIKSLPTRDWIAFTIANKEDEELIPPAVKICLDHHVSYTCSAGELATMTEEYFDEEITWRAVGYEQETGKDFDYDQSPVTTFHQNFGEGFWYASTLANDDNFEIDKVVCIDFTKRKVKRHLSELIDKINNQWLPSDDEIDPARYDH
ncbi:hypothetical protein [Tunicatimonas pelagia]|uniref:hypothetical protein n=1 Tax=Tunicatimonas pelagia TaxID=931531 RepID=UPI0026668736|nr:hypothetical protein [Tunicatimonas pelagia]WKN43575.1 hypothetical protein P0M28_01150 [Tunicatimonas pelagia]